MADGDTKAWSGDEWCTPPEIWQRALRAFGVTFVLDPFPNEASTVPRFHGPDLDGIDGFTSDWSTLVIGGEAFVNPPFSRAGDAVRKCVEEWMRHVTIIAVVPASLNSTHWEHVDLAPAVCSPFRRVAFERDGKPSKGNRQDVVIAYWGADPWRFREAFRDYGRVRFG